MKCPVCGTRADEEYDTPRKTNNFLKSLILQIPISIELDTKMKGKK